MTTPGGNTVTRQDITLSLDSELLDELRNLIGDTDLGQAIDAAISAHVTNLQQLVEAEEWITELKEHDEANRRSSGRG